MFVWLTSWHRFGAGAGSKPCSQAFLLPSAPDATNMPQVVPPIEPVVMNRLQKVQPGSNLHLALVEVVRRQVKLAAMAADKADKEAARAALK